MISPPKGPTSRLALPSGSPEYSAAQAQREANQEIQAANQAVQDARQQADASLDQIHDSYEKRIVQESSNDDAEYEKQRLKGYEHLRDLKRSMDLEQSRVHREGERNLDHLNRYYRDSTYTTEQRGEQRLKQLENDQARMLAQTKEQRSGELEAQKDLYGKQSEEVRQSTEMKMAKVKADSDHELQKFRARTDESSARAQDLFNHNFAERTQRDDQMIVNLENRAAQQVREIRRDTSQKLSAYASRQSDPFYRMIDLGVHVSNQGGDYVLTATIPPHEQAHVAVTIKGDQLVLSGYRRNQEQLELGPGRTESTSAYQTFAETFPITWPVDANKMTREFKGSQMIVRIPKKNDYAYHPKADPKSQLVHARLERPKFPENIPHVNQDPYAESAEPQGEIAGKSKGSGTLS